MKAAPIVKQVKSGAMSLAVRAYGDGRFGFDYLPGPGEERIKVRLREVDAAVSRAREILGATSAGKLDLLAIDGRDFAEFLQWKNAKRKVERVPAMVEKFLASKKSKGKSEAHVRQLEGILQKFAGTFDDPIDQLQRDAVEKWLDSRRVGNRRWNNLLSAIIALMRFARRDGALSSDMTPVELIERRTVTVTVQTYSADELRALLDIIPRDWLPAIVLGAFAGIRPEEICPDLRSAKPALRWENILWQKRKIDVPAEVSKIRRRRFVPLLDAPASFLAPWRGSTGPVVPRMKMSDMTARWAKKAGIAWKPDALRHSYASYRLAIIKDIQELSLEMGNSSDMIHRHYLDLKHDDEAAEWFSIRPAQARNLVTLGT